ncbi:glycosyltransferase family 2 protein [Adhaeribacter aquaticus]|uniref:glycosyltransferase family 2 protein n=1 Tax=Adhaeribacter aquaticus TaxID=299567 RepID=UPI0004070D5D|nr:glycosyltransferase family A protein [Adhaeribacter aquaticus]
MDTLLVSVILPVYNQEKFLAETIESVLSQTYKDFELLILDDGSTDKSPQIIKEYAAKDKRIVPYFEQNAGRSLATNKIVERANGKFCALLDADDLMLNDRLEKQLNFHLANPEIDATSCHSYYIDEWGKTMGVQQYAFLQTAEECRRVKEEKRSVICSITGLMITKKAYLETGGFRPKFWPCDDFDFINRIIEKGFLLVIIQEVLMKYRIHSSSVTGKKQWQLFKIYDYANHCMNLRWTNKPEVSLEEYEKIRSKEPLLVKWKRMNHNYSILFLQKANFSLYTKNYFKFLYFFSVASFFGPKYVFYSVQKRLKQN